MSPTAIHHIPSISLPINNNNNNNDNPDVESLTNYIPPPPSPLKTPMPAFDARPPEVRDYLAQLLVLTRGVEDDEAQRAVAGWQVGSGVELRRYGAEMYQNVFGYEWGWALFWEVALRKNAETVWVLRYKLHTATIFSIALSVTTISLIATLEMVEGVTIALIFAALFGTIAMLVCSVLQCFGIGSSEKKMIERELKGSRGAGKVAITAGPAGSNVLVVREGGVKKEQ